MEDHPAAPKSPAANHRARWTPVALNASLWLGALAAVGWYWYKTHLNDAILQAAYRGDMATTRRLLAWDFLPDRHRTGTSALSSALDHGHSALATALIGDGFAGASSMCAAADAGDVAAMDALARSGVGANSSISGGQTALLFASRRGLGATKWLVDHGADVNTAYSGIGPDHGATPLVHALMCSDLATMRYLLDHGADPNIHFDSGNSYTPLMTAMSFGPQYVHILLVHGADVNAMDVLGRSVLWYAKRQLNGPRRSECPEVIRVLQHTIPRAK